MGLIELIKENARKEIQRIVLPESLEERTLKAASTIMLEELAQVILIGNPDEILKNSQALLNRYH